jgi:hypothetical protein
MKVIDRRLRRPMLATSRLDDLMTVDINCYDLIESVR